MWAIWSKISTSFVVFKTRKDLLMIDPFLWKFSVWFRSSLSDIFHLPLIGKSFTNLLTIFLLVSYTIDSSLTFFFYVISTVITLIQVPNPPSLPGLDYCSDLLKSFPSLYFVPLPVHQVTFGFCSPCPQYIWRTAILAFLKQWFSNSAVHQNQNHKLLATPLEFLIQWVRGGLRICISNTFPGCTAAASLETTFWEPPA